MSHTPGPWARNISPKYPVYAEADHKKVALALNGHDVSDEEAMANLKLIAAAPDLLVALQKTLFAMRTIADNAGDVPEWNEGGQAYEASNLARAAITKATS